MTSKLSWVWAQITARLWFRVSLYAGAAVATVLLATFASPLVPRGLADLVREGAARDLLTILASSMLVVATFSLGTMVQAYAAAASLATPRAAHVLIDDPFSQNVLATFLGAFVFSMVGLVAQNLSYYTGAGEAVLLFAIVCVITVVIVTLFGWLDHLANLVRLGETVRKIEGRAARVLRARAAAPHLGGVPLPDAPPTNWAVAAAGTGYVRHLDVAALQQVAERAGGVIAVHRLPGALADPVSALTRTSWPADDAQTEAIRAAFTLGPERSFDEDPRFGLSVLAEIGSRALSPGVNDPGTAIGVVTTLQRLLTLWAQTPDASEDRASCTRVMVPALAVEDLFEDAFGPLMRDGAPIVEVGLRLQEALATLTAVEPRFASSARDLSARALQHATAALRLPQDHARLAAVAAGIGAGP